MVTKQLIKLCVLCLEIQIMCLPGCSFRELSKKDIWGLLLLAKIKYQRLELPSCLKQLKNKRKRKETTVFRMDSKQHETVIPERE